MAPLSTGLRSRRARRGRARRTVIALAASLLAGAGLAHPAPSAIEEYAVKAAFLLNFARFVEWPEDSFATAESPMRICVLGEDPFGAVLDRTIDGQLVSGRRVEAARTADAEELAECQVAFVSRSERSRIDAVIARVADAPVLTVSEVDGFAGRGGTINFFLDTQRVRFEVNPAAASRSGLRISSELLRLGRIVEVAPARGRT